MIKKVERKDDSGSNNENINVIFTGRDNDRC